MTLAIHATSSQKTKSFFINVVGRRLMKVDGVEVKQLMHVTCVSDVLPLNCLRDSISDLTSFGASNLSCRQTQCRFRVAVERYVNAA